MRPNEIVKNILYLLIRCTEKHSIFYLLCVSQTRRAGLCLGP
jgi:hypothetical protein